MMKQHLFFKSVSLLLFFLCFNVLSAQSTLVGWSMLGQSNYGDTILSPTFTNDSIYASSLTKNFLTSASGLSDAWGGRNFTANTSEGGPYYAEFSIAPLDTFVFTLSELTLNYRRSGTGPAAALLQYSMNSGAFNTVSHLQFTETTATELTPVTLPSHIFTNVDDTVTFRIIPYNATSATGTWYISHIEDSVLDLSIRGEFNTHAQEDTVDVLPCVPIADLVNEVTEASSSSFSWSYDSTLSQTFFLAYKEVEETVWERIALDFEEVLIGVDGADNLYAYTLTELEELTQYDVKVIVNCDGYEYDSELIEIMTTETEVNYDHILVGWSMQGQNNYGDSLLAPTYVNDTVVVNALSKNFSTSASGLSDAWGGRDFLSNTAEGGPYYAQFSLAPNHDSLALDINEIRLNYRRSGTGPTEALIQYSLDNQNFETITTTLFPSTTSATAEPILLPQTAFSNIQSPVYFRIIPYGASSATGTWYIPHLNNTDFDLFVIGEITDREVEDTTVTTHCGPVEDLHVADVGRDFVMLEWSYPTGMGEQFIIKYKKQTDAEINEIDISQLYSEFQQPEGSSNFIYTLYELEQETPYILWLSVVCDGETYQAEKVEFTTDAPPASINDNNSTNSNFKVFISENTLHLNNQNNVHVNHLIMYNLQGQVQLRRSNLSDSWTSPFNFPKGLYIMQLITDTERIVFKVVNS